MRSCRRPRQRTVFPGVSVAGAAQRGVMRTRTIKISVFLGLGLAGVALASGTVSYTGDGTLKDYGKSHPLHRYVLDLGSIDLAKNSMFKFKVGALPNRSFVFGFRLKIDPPQPNIMAPLPITTRVRLTLTDSTGKVLINEDASLRDWTWSYPGTGDSAFIYRRGENSNGTYVNPQLNMQYTLVCGIIRGKWISKQT